jgi:peptide/nickel transport system permease protein
MTIASFPLAHESDGVRTASDPWARPPSKRVRRSRLFTPTVGRLLLRRIGISIPTVIFASIGLFLVMRAVPGGPAIGILGVHATPAAVAAINQELGLNHPLYYQYWQWLDGVFHGNLGQSFQTHQPVLHMISEALPVSAELVALSLVFTLVVAVPIGVIAACRRGTGVDRAVTNVSGVGLAVPDFFLAIVLVAIFGTWAHVLPELGFVRLTRSIPGNLDHLVLPTLAMGMGASAVIIRQVRAGMIDALQAPYILTARAMGLPESKVVWRYALRNALPTVLNVYGLLAIGMFGATLIFEQVFVLPGMGNLLVNAVGYRDYPLIQGIALTYVVLVIVVNLLVDIVVGVLNPRLAQQ